MEREIIRHLLEQLEGRFSFYKVNGSVIEAKVASSGLERVFKEEDVKNNIDNYTKKEQVMNSKKDLRKKLENGDCVCYFNSHAGYILVEILGIYSDSLLVQNGRLRQSHPFDCFVFVDKKDAKIAEAVANDSSVEVEKLHDPENFGADSWCTLRSGLLLPFFEGYNEDFKYQLKPNQESNIANLSEDTKEQMRDNFSGMSKKMTPYEINILKYFKAMLSFQGVRECDEERMESFDKIVEKLEEELGCE